MNTLTPWVTQKADLRTTGNSYAATPNCRAALSGTLPTKPFAPITHNAKTYLKPDNNCNMSDVNPVYDKDTYKQRLNRMPTIIEMPYNEVVQQFIDRYSGRLRRSVSYMLGAQNFYIPIFEQALETYGMPLELKYLPVIESALNPKAVSRVGATGLWQFMVTTGKQYGLEVNSMVDERCDPVKSSYAAANYLSDLYKIFGDWNLVIAAYNCGPDNINKAIHRANGAKDYWEIYPYLPKDVHIATITDQSKVVNESVMNFLQELLSVADSTDMKNSLGAAMAACHRDMPCPSFSM